MQFKAEVKVTLKAGVLDPQGSAVRGALIAMGYNQFSGVRVGKHIEVWMDAVSIEAARAAVTEVGKRLLSNPVLETFTLEIEPAVMPTASGSDA